MFKEYIYQLVCGNWKKGDFFSQYLILWGKKTTIIFNASSPSVENFNVRL